MIRLPALVALIALTGCATWSRVEVGAGPTAERDVQVWKNDTVATLRRATVRGDSLLGFEDQARLRPRSVSVHDADSVRVKRFDPMKTVIGTAVSGAGLIALLAILEPNLIGD